MSRQGRRYSSVPGMNRYNTCIYTYIFQRPHLPQDSGITAAFVFQPLHATDPGGVALLPRERHNSSWSKAAVRPPGGQGKFRTGETTRLQRRRAASVVPGKRRRYVFTLFLRSSFTPTSFYIISACIDSRGSFHGTLDSFLRILQGKHPLRR